MTGFGTKGVRPSEFAEKIGTGQSYVNKLKNAGRLVLADDGLIDPVASMARIEATRRGSDDDEPAGQISVFDLDGLSFQAAKAKRAHFECLLAEQKFHQTARQYVERQKVEEAVNAALVVIDNAFRAFIDDAVKAVVLAMDQGEGEIRAALEDCIHTFLHGLSDALAASAPKPNTARRQRR